MQLSVKDVARLLNLSDRAVFKLIETQRLPAFKNKRNSFINKADLLEWAIAHGYTLPPELFNSDIPAQELPMLCDCMKPETILFKVPGIERGEILRNVVAAVPDINIVEREQLLGALVAREMMGSTAIGNGIAIPHVRTPIVLTLSRPQVILCFLRNSVDFGALDSINVSILFVLLSTSIRVHLHLLARLSYLLSQQSIRDRIVSSTPADEIISMLTAVESAIPKR